jgi:hypothetical protein
VCRACVSIREITTALRHSDATRQKSSHPYQSYVLHISSSLHG